MRGERLALLSSDRNCFSKELLRKTWAFCVPDASGRLGASEGVHSPVSEGRGTTCREVPTNTPRRLADSPPQPTEYDFEVSLRMGCLVYVGLCQSAIDDLPSSIAPDQTVDVSVEKHVMGVRVLDGREITMEITRHYRASLSSCSSGR
jgi:hypothetical protein